MLRWSPKRWARLVAGGVVAATIALVSAAAAPSEARAASPFLEVPPEEEVTDSPAYRYANMTDAEAFAELDRRKVPYTREKATPGVRAPVRLAGSLHEVWIHSSLSPEERATSMFEILDARLALALDDFSVILARHDVVELVHYTMYRPNVPPPGAAPVAPTADEKPEPKKGARGKGKRRASLEGKAQKGPKGTRKNGGGARRKEIDIPEEGVVLTGEDLAKGPKAQPKAAAQPKAQPKSPAQPKAPAQPKQPSNKKPASKADARGRSAKKVIVPAGEHDHAKWAPPGTRHPAGLAIDVGILKKRDGSLLHVAAHFDGKIGARTCGEGAPEAEKPAAKELREIVCEAREAGVFTYALTPNFDASHVDHFHMEIKPGVKWFLYH
ncbi:MAG: hypothetical protein JNL21_00480 [Myxococcales bacterium]|nr:hypothetical protein [Myxococcales bacterium]